MRGEGESGSSRELRFSVEDVERFAAASGDRNPLHLDPGYARHTPFGSCVVHGALVTIGMLGSLAPDELANVRVLRARFSGPVMPGAPCRVVLTPSRRSAGAWELTLGARGKVLARVLAGHDRDLVSRNLGSAMGTQESGPPGATEPEMRLTPADPTPAELTPGMSLRGAYSAADELASVAGRFGAQPLERSLLEGLAWASYVVGMELPGLRSLLAGITLAALAAANRSPSARHCASVREHDPRTGQLVLDGGLFDRSGSPLSAGTIECFALAAIASPDAEALGVSGPVAADRGSVVVIGGSRGFGAALALALLTRGYRVHVAYSSSSERAAELSVLAGRHGHRLTLHQLDASQPAAVAELSRALAPEAPLAGIVLGAAPPPLAMGLSVESGPELADYVGQSLRLAAVPLGSLLPLLGSDAWILFCSSSAISAPPRDWPHYVTAKSALEGLASWVGANAPGVRSVVLRPPAMRTEMTNTPSGRIAAVPAESIATWTADRLVAGELEPGLTVLEPRLVAEVGR